MATTALSLKNQTALEDLLVAIEANGSRLGIFIAVCDDLALREEIIGEYEHRLAPSFRHHRLKLDRREPSIKALIRHQVSQDAYLQQPNLAIMTITGSERLLAIRLGNERSEQEVFFGYLQWTREGLRAFPFAIVLWVTHEMLKKLSRQAPDFWSWRQDVFRFDSEENIPISYISPHTQLHRHVGEAISENAYLLPSTESRTVSITTALQQQDFKLSLPEEIRETIPLEDVEVLIGSTAAKNPHSLLLASLHNQAGQLYVSRLQQNIHLEHSTEIEKAINHLQAAQALYKKSTPSEVQVNNCLLLAKLKMCQGNEAEAIALLDQSLEMIENIGYSQGKAAVLHQLGSIKVQQGDIDGAIALFKSSLKIK